MVEVVLNVLVGVVVVRMHCSSAPLKVSVASCKLLELLKVHVLLQD